MVNKLVSLLLLLLVTEVSAGPTQGIRDAAIQLADSAAAAQADPACPPCPPCPPPTPEPTPTPTPTPVPNECTSDADCYGNNSECITSGFWKGWCCDERENFRSLSSGTEGQMTHNANARYRTPRGDKRTIRYRFDVKFDGSWITNCVAPGQHLGSLWAAYGGGDNTEEWIRRNIRIDFSRQCTDGFDIVLQAYKSDTPQDGDIKFAIDTRISGMRVPGAYRAGIWRTTIVTATYDPGEGRVYGTVEYVGAGIRSFSHTDSDARDFPVGWTHVQVGNVDGPNRSDFGVTFRNRSIEVF